jgi:Aldo/keto reductase family
VAPLHSTQPPYNIFERQIEKDVLRKKLLVLSYGAICRGLLSGRMSLNRKFDGDDLRLKDPKFQQPRFAQYIKAADRLGQHAWSNHGKSLLAFAIRWILDRGETLTALWGARNAGQLDAVEQAFEELIFIACAREGTGGGVTYDVGTLNGQNICKRGLKTRAEAIAYIDEVSVEVDAEFIKALLAKDVLPRVTGGK